MTDEGKDLVPVIGIKETTPRKEMDIDAARGVLQALVSTHENSITETSPLDQMSGYSVDQVREAILVVGEDLMVSNGAREVFYAKMLQKRVPQGNVSLSIKQGFNQEGKPTGRSYNIKLELSAGGNYVLESWFPLAEQTNDAQRVFTGFSDFRENRVISAYQLRKDFKLEDYRYMVRGLRWMSANMLNWDTPQLIMPEQLDNLPLANPQTPPSLLPSQS